MARRLLSSFRTAVLWPLAVGSIVSAILLWTLLPGVLHESAATQLTDALHILTPLVSDRLDRQPRQLQEWLEDLAKGTDLRVTVVRGDGVVLADSARTWSQVGQMDNHRERPEIATAMAERMGKSVRQSATTGLDYLYVARTGTDPGGRLFVLRVAQPLSELASLKSSLFKVMVVTGLLSLIAVALVWIGLDRSLFRPLKRVVQGANRMALGEEIGHIDVPRAEELGTLATSLNRLSDRVAEQLERVRSERNDLQEILSSMVDGILVIDSDGQVRFANATFRELFQVQGEIGGRSPLEITRRPEVLSLIKAARDDQDQVSEEALAIEGGSVLSASAVPIGGGGVLLVAHDVTERVHLDETRRDFVANVSHEIKTPLTAIRGYAETLKDGAMHEPEVATKFMDRILGQCERLEALLSDLLPLARMEAAQVQELKMQPIDLVGMIEQAVELVRSKAEKRGISIEVDLPGEPPQFEGDVDSMDQLISNLLDNAVKYNRERGSIRISLTTVDGHIVLVVADTGLGIPAESVPRVFERFYRVDKGRARDEGGTGLGLALVKHAALLHGGSVDLKSQLGAGSTFRVVLPTNGWARSASPGESSGPSEEEPFGPRRLD